MARIHQALGVVRGGVLLEGWGRRFGSSGECKVVELREEKNVQLHYVKRVECCFFIFNQGSSEFASL